MYKRLSSVGFMGKLLIAFAMPLLVMLCVSFVSHLNTRSLVEDSKWVQHTHKVIADGRELLVLLLDMETGKRGFLLTGKEEFLEPFERSQAVWTDKVTTLQKLVSDNPPQVERLERIRMLHEGWMENAAIVAIEARRDTQEGQRDMRPVIDLEQRETGKEIIDAIRLEISEFITVEEALIVKRSEKSNASVERTTTVIILGGFLSLAVGLVIAIIVSNDIRERIASLVVLTERLGSGNLGRQAMVPVDRGSDELGRLSQSFYRLQEKLRLSERKAKAYNLRLIRSSKKSETAARVKGEFLSTMSHEIRTPMNGVLGMLNLLIDGGLDPEKKHYAKTAKDSAESLLAIINDVLDFSKIEAGKVELELIDINIRRLLEDVNGVMNVSAARKSVVLLCPDNLETDYWYKGDLGRIRQILVNLVGNAIKFTDRGEVAVRVEESRISDKATRIRFEVCDQGIGISQEQQKRLFAKFTQADSSTTREYGGTGLGLSICKQLVQLMGGEIGVTSYLGKGSTFWFEIELENVEDRLQSDVEHLYTDKKVLLVSKDQRLEQSLGAVFGQLDWVADRAEALQSLAINKSGKTSYQLCFFDQSEDSLMELEWLSKASAVGGGKDVRFVLVNSDPYQPFSAAQRVSYYRAGVSEVLSVPLDQKAIEDLVCRIYHIVPEESESEMKQDPFACGPCYSGRILVVDDGTTNQLVAQSMLSRLGIRVEKAGNGEEAINALRTSPGYDLIFMDCQMPVMDGFQATTLIRKNKLGLQDHDVPIVAITANAMEGDEARCIEAGMDDYLAKPIDPWLLRRKLDKWLLVKADQPSGQGTLREATEGV